MKKKLVMMIALCIPHLTQAVKNNVIGIYLDNQSDQGILVKDISLYRGKIFSTMEGRSENHDAYNDQEIRVDPFKVKKIFIEYENESTIPYQLKFFPDTFKKNEMFFKAHGMDSKIEWILKGPPTSDLGDDFIRQAPITHSLIHNENSKWEIYSTPHRKDIFPYYGEFEGEKINIFDFLSVRFRNSPLSITSFF